MEVKESTSMEETIIDEWNDYFDDKPKVAGTYIVTSLNGEVFSLDYDLIRGFGKNNGNIVAWQHFPKPYRKQMFL